MNRGRQPPSLAPLVHNPFAPACRGRACPARSFAITASLSLASQGGSLPPPRRPEGWPPYVLPVDCCLPAGRRGRRPPTGITASLPAICRGGIYPSRTVSPLAPVPQSASSLRLVLHTPQQILRLHGFFCSQYTKPRCFTPSTIAYIFAYITKNGLSASFPQTGRLL